MGTWDLDVDSRLQTWSAETEVLHGLVPGTFEGTFAAFKRTVHPDDWPSFEREMRTSLRERRDSIVTHRTVWPDGSMHWLEDRGRAVRAADDTVVRVTGTSMDITARKQAEMELSASEQRNRLALRSAHMGTWEWDAIHNVHSWSSETEVLFGRPRGSFAGSVAAFRQSIHPDDWPALDEEWRSSLREHRDFTASYRAIWPDGTIRWIEDNGSGIYAADGALVRTTGTSMDVTERKLTEAALRSSEERFRMQYKGIPLPTYSWLCVGDDFVLEDYNDAAEALVGVGIRDWLGVRASARYADEPQILADLKLCVADHATVRREVHYRYPDTRLERDLTVTYVFVPPLTVMIHTEDATRTPKNLWIEDEVRTAA